LRKERRLKVFENRVSTGLFVPKRAEVTRDWRKLHNKELNDLYSSPSIVCMIKSERLRRTGRVARIAARRDVYRILMEKPEGRRSLERLRHRWEDNIKMDLQEMICGSIDWIDLAEVRDRWRALVKLVMNLRVP
jgi:hypothetical protein